MARQVDCARAAVIARVVEVGGPDAGASILAARPGREIGMIGR